MGNIFSRVYPPTSILNATCGPIRGILYEQEDGSCIEGYLGIPYAEPPIGELRFKKPVEFQRWDEPRDCFKFGPRAPQNDELLGQFVNTVGKSEAHCLTLNVFCPRTPPNSPPLPVMVFIHGGGFAVHSTSNYGSKEIARNLCTKGVVVVSINYRLGVLGFFTTGDEVCRGNLGLWDQTMALKWVRKHVASFGGDPDIVTVFGQSAGGASTDLLCLSPHSRDLFHRAIPMAGCGECDFAIRSSEQQTALSKEYARYLGWDGNDDDSEDLLKFMNSQPLHNLEMGINPKRGFRHSQAGNLYFVPNVDGDFFPKPLSELRSETTVKQIMTGTTQFEGLFFVALGAISRSPDGIRKFMKRIIKPCDYGENSEEVVNMVFDYYFKGANSKDSQRRVEQLVKFIGDWSINYGVYKLANTMATNTPVYFYCFEYFNPNGFGIFKWLMPFLGSTHCSEVRYVLGKGIFSKFRPNVDDKIMLGKMTDYFTNFAKYGNPNGENVEDGIWVEHDPGKPYKYFNINLKSEMLEEYQNRRMELWERVREKNITRLTL